MAAQPKYDSSFGSMELLQIADAVAREKNIDKNSVIEALEEAIRVAARRKYGHEHSIRAEIDRKTGEMRLFREMLVIDPEAQAVISEEEQAEQASIAAEDDRDHHKKEMNTITLEEAKLKKADAQIGYVISEPLPPIDLGRVAAQSAKQVITHRVREIERNKQFEEFKDKVGQIVSGVVEKIEYGNAIVKLGSTEALLKREYTIRNEKIKQGERIRAYVSEVNKDNKGHQIILSRTHGEFLAALFAQEVPEIYDRVIEIKAIARDPGSRAKVAVFSSDSSIDPVGSCVGMRGARVQAVINELSGEKIDIIQWSSDPATMVVNALAPAEVTKVIIDEDNKRIEIIVPDEQLSIAIGKRGQNVRLASKLIGWQIDVLTEETESKRRNDEFNAITKKFMQALDVEEILAQLLASEGFVSIQDLIDTGVTEIAAIDGLDEGLAQELINRAIAYAETHDDASQAPAVPVEINISKLDKSIMTLSGMTEEIACKMYATGIRTLTQLADLSRDEFVEKVPDSGLEEAQIDTIIMAARNATMFNN
jgi:N utilization substance protein A